MPTAVPGTSPLASAVRVPINSKRSSTRSHDDSCSITVENLHPPQGSQGRLATEWQMAYWNPLHEDQSRLSSSPTRSVLLTPDTPGFSNSLPSVSPETPGHPFYTPSPTSPVYHLPSASLFNSRRSGSQHELLGPLGPFFSSAIANAPPRIAQVEDANVDELATSMEMMDCMQGPSLEVVKCFNHDNCKLFQVMDKNNVRLGHIWLRFEQDHVAQRQAARQGAYTHRNFNANVAGPR